MVGQTDEMAEKQRDMRDLEKEKHWRKVVEEWRASKLSGVEFCRGASLNESTFYSWIKVIAARDREAKVKRAGNEPVFVPVAIKASSNGKTTSEGSAALQRVEIWCSNGDVIRAASMTTRALIELVTGLGKGTC